MKKILFVLLTLFMLFSSNVYAQDSYFSQELGEISALLQRCENSNIETVYESVQFNVLTRFAGYIEQDIADGVDSAIIEYNKNKMNEMYLEAKSNLTAYLSGDKDPKYAKLNNMQNVISKNGNLFDKNTPVFSIGYGHFSSALNDIPNMNGFGANNVQIELGPKRVISEGGIPSWWISGGMAYELNQSIITEGVNSLKFNSGSAATAQLWQPVYVGKGGIYNLTFKLRATSGTNMAVTVKYGQDVLGTVTPSGSWTTYSYNVTEQNGAVGNSVIFNLSGQGTLYVDEIKFVEVSSEIDYIINGGFEDELCMKNIVHALDSLKKAEINGVGVSLLLSPHYFPEDMTDEGLYSTSPEFIKYNINHPKALEIIEDYLRYVIPIISKYPALSNICLSNEPLFDTRTCGDFYTQMFRDYLKHKYSNIETLKKEYNDRWSYWSFDWINMPSSYISSKSPIWYDWVNFNNKVFADWHKWMADIVKEYTDIPVHSKLSAHILYDREWSMVAGIDTELFDEFSDWAGNDVAAYYDEDGKLFEKMMWYDFLHSVTGKPIYNSEDHIIEDRNFDFVDNQAKHLRTDLWQGAIHSRAMSTIWVWERSYDSTQAYSGSILLRPDCVWQAGKTSLDLTRLANEVSKINSKKPDVAIFWSRASSIYDDNHTATMKNFYEALVTSGLKVGFVTENSLEKLSEYDTVIVPCVKYTTGEAHDAFVNYINNGGKVIADTKPFVYDEYTKTVSDNSAFDNVIYTTEDIVSSIRNNIEREVYFVDKETGEEVNDVEWQYYIMNDEVLVNICNMEFDTAKTLIAYYNGNPVACSYDVLNGTKYSEEIVAKGYEPILIRVGEEDIISEEPKTVMNVKLDENGLLTWTQNDKFYKKTVIYNAYTKELVGQTVSTNYNLPEYGTYMIKIVNTVGQEGKPVFVTYSNEKMFTVDARDVKVNKDTISLNVSVTNNSQSMASGTVIVLVKDDSGNVLNKASHEKKYESKENKEIRLSLFKPEGATNIEIKVCESRLGNVEYSNVYSEIFSEVE